MHRKTLAFLLALTAPWAVGCVKKTNQAGRCDRPDLGGCVIEGVDVVGNQAVGDGDIKEKIATAETSHVIGGVVKNVPVLSLWDRLTVEYERLDPFVLQRDLARIERYYRARGYYEAHVQAGRVLRKKPGEVQVEIAVDEGAPVRVGKIDLEWKDWSLPVAGKVTPSVNDAVGSLKKGDIFAEDTFEDAKRKILRAMTNRGFAYAKVEGKAEVDLTRHEAAIVYTLELGPRCVFGDVTLEGQGDLPSVPLLAAIQLKKGAQFSTSALDSAEVALGDFGLFGSIDVQPQLSPAGQPPNPVIPVVVHVQPAALRAVKLGIGAEAGGRYEVHGLAGWEHRNFLGGLRHFTVDLSPAVTFYWPDTGDIKGLPEFRLRASLIQPGVLLPLEPRTTGVLGGSFRLYRPTLDNLVGYVEATGTAGLERPFWDAHVKLGLSFNFQFDRPVGKGILGGEDFLNYEGSSDLQLLYIPYMAITAALDFRRSEAKRIDPVNPHSGFYLLNELQIAYDPTSLINNKHTPARDVRFRPEIRGYVPVSKRVTLALRLAGGVLKPFDNSYGDDVRAKDAATEFNAAGACYDYQMLQFRGFYSGGATSNRGYSYQGVGPHEKGTCLSQLQSTRNDDEVATGGFNLWETSVELRFPIQGSVGAVVFADASDVTRGNVRLCAPHLSTGFGLRYETPVGPIRADLGYRVHGAQYINPCGKEYAPEPLGGKLPIALSVAIGEAF